MAAEDPLPPVAESPEEAVGITQANDGDPPRLADWMRRTITNGHTPVNATDLDDFSFKSKDLAHGIGASCERCQAVDRGSRPDQGEKEFRSQKDAGGGGETRRPASEIECRHGRPEGFQLAPIEGMVGILATGEMAEDQRDLEVAERVPIGRQLRQLVGRKPQAVDAGIDMES